MTKEIEFPDSEPLYIFDRDCLAFGCVVDGKPVECLVTAEFLQAHFGPSDITEEAMRHSFRTHREEIEAIARAHIVNGWVDEDSRIFLTTRFTRMQVRFSDGFDVWPVGLAAAEGAHRILTKIIGPDAEQVIVEWGAVGPSGPGIRGKIMDPTIAGSVTVYLEAPQWNDPSILTYILARAWSSVLRERSRELFLKSG
jgi:hypothetical protein